LTTLIGFSTPARFNPVSWLVRRLTGSKASHAFFIYDDMDWGCQMVLEAHELGFRLIPLEHFRRRNKVLAVFEPCVDISAGVQFVALEYLGEPYDFGGLIGFSFVLLGRWLRKKWHNPLHSTKAVFCSEACVVALQCVNYPNASGLVPYDTEPQALFDFCSQEMPLAGN
jgi:hypothetical protein